MTDARRDLPESLVCPLTRQQLHAVPLERARALITGGLPLSYRLATSASTPMGETDIVLLRSDSQAAYPIVDGHPVLLAPEILTHPNLLQSFNLNAPQYAEAYSEMDYYNEVGRREAAAMRQLGSLAALGEVDDLQNLQKLGSLSERDRASFPQPPTLWLASRIDIQSEWDCYHYLGDVRQRRVLQLGGSGSLALRLLLAGADEAVLLTPMLGEAERAIETAKLLGLGSRIRCVIGVAEELPLSDDSFDVAISGGCVHHMRTDIAFAEIARVLRPGGKFAAIEPWRAPLHSIGTNLFGKREPGVFCKPLTPARVAPLSTAFRQSCCVQHGAVSRYVLLGLEKFGIRTPAHRTWWIGNVDDQLSSVIGLRRLGSGVALLATK